MFDFLGSLFDASGFPPRWRCGAWTPEHGWLHVLSDLGVWSAYMAIPAVLGYFIARKKDVPFRGIFLLFTAFILACGTTHLMEAVIFWWPAYRLAGVLKLVTAAVSWVTVVALVRVTPVMMAMRTPEELEREVAARRAAEAGLERANADLERRVRERTDELTRANAALSAERERFRTTLSSIGDAVIATDTAGRVTFLNPVAEALTGWSAGGAAGEDLRSVFHIVNETTRAEVENPALRALRDGVVVGLANHTVLIARDAREWPIDDCAAPIRDAAGGVAGAVLVFRDITERKRAEREVARLVAASERQRRLYETVLTNTPDFVYVFSLDHRVLYANDALIRMWGRGTDGAIGKTFLEIGYEPWHAERHDREIDTVRATKQPIRGEVPFTGTTGRREYDYIFVPVLGADCEVEAVAGTTRDVTERKEAERAVRAAEERLRTALTAARMVAWEWTPADRKLRLSENAADVYGLPAGVEPTTIDEGLVLLHPDDATAYRANYLRAIDDRTGYVIRYRLVRPNDGRVIWIEERGNVGSDGPDGGVRLFGVATDVTARERAEAELRASEDRYRTLLERIPDPLFVYDRETLGYLAVNEAAVVAYGYTRDEFLGMTIKDIRPAGDVPALLDMLARSPGGFEDRGRWRHRKKDGTVIDVEVTAHDLDLDGRPACLVLARDVTARRRAEQELYLRDRAIQAVAAGIVIADATAPDTPILYASPGFERLTGYTGAEVLGRNCRFLQGPRTDPAEVAELRRAVREGRPYDGEVLNYRKDGTPFWNQLHISPVRDDAGRLTHFIGVQSDVTGRRQLEEQLRQAVKLEAVGQLAGGVAHDFNNLLTVVNGCGELLLDELPPDAPARSLVEDVVRAGQRGAALTRQLLAFSRQQMLRVEVFDPNRVLLDTAKLLARLLGEDVVLRTVLDPAAGFVKGDVGQVEQVVINLAVNGRDAMPRGGTLTVETAPTEVTAADLALSPDARPGRYVRIAVTDTGTGMPPEVQARLFEPFFTTKEVGKGTGLGLATVYGIVRQSGGFLTVRSAVGAGTTIAVHLPRHEPEPGGSKSAPWAKPRAAGSETVLVVEDDDAVRALTTAVLVRQGYRVEAAESGAAALALCDRLPAPPELVLTDVVMPGMSGRELAEELTARFPRVKVVFLSGYTADAVLRHGVEEERVAFLQKPYTPDRLVRFVREVLDGNPGPV